jgi:hypothetical protein
MRVEDTVTIMTHRLLGRLLWRALAAAAAIAFAVAAVCYFSGAGKMALISAYGELTALTIMGIVFAVLALIALIVGWAIARKPAHGAALANPQNAQLVMLVEALMLGYSLARRGDRAR